MISDQEAFEMWLETGCVPLEYAERIESAGFSTVLCSECGGTIICVSGFAHICCPSSGLR